MLGKFFAIMPMNHIDVDCYAIEFYGRDEEKKRRPKRTKKKKDELSQSNGTAVPVT